MNPLPAVILLAMLPAACAAKPVPYSHPSGAIVRVMCILPNGASVGTATKIGPDKYVTAAHVVNQGICTADGGPIRVTHLDEANDFAMFDGPISPSELSITCSGYRENRHYIAWGYAFGGIDLFALPLEATAATDGEESLLIGQVIPGMSGGPVFDRDGRVTGIVNQQLSARSLPLSATPLCR